MCLLKVKSFNGLFPVGAAYANTDLDRCISVYKFAFTVLSSYVRLPDVTLAISSSTSHKSEMYKAFKKEGTF